MSSTPPLEATMEEAEPLMAPSEPMVVTEELITSLTNTPLRDYQRRAVRVALSNNAIVVLPTGAGKTLIAAAVVKHAVMSNPNRPKALFLVPTCMLVRQQTAVLREETGLNVVEFMRGRPAPTDFDVIVSTPAAFINVMNLAPHLSLGNFSHVTFDEVHHTSKNHPYITIAESIELTEQPVRVLGLSATLTYATEVRKIYESVGGLCKLLGVRSDCVITSSTEDLRAAGYHAADVEPEVTLVPAYVTLDNDNEMCARLEIYCSPHEQLKIFLQHVDKRWEPIHTLTLALMAVVRDIEQKARKLNDKFVEPRVFKDKIGDWGQYAHEFAWRQDAGSSVERLLFVVLENLYEAVRIIVASNQTSLELAMRFLEMTKLLGADSVFSSEHIATLQKLWVRYQPQFQRCPHLKNVLLQMHERYGEDLHAIIFVKQRVVAHIVAHYIEADPDLSQVCRPVIAYSSQTRATPTLALSKRDIRENISMFSEGEKNVLVATSVAEEGMDVSAANCVIRFDAFENTVSMVQSRGRARMADSSFVVLAEQPSRPVSHFMDAERLASAVLQESLPENIAEAASVRKAKDLGRQLQSKISAHKRSGPDRILLKYGVNPEMQSALQTLKEFASCTKSQISETYRSAPSGWSVRLALMTSGEEVGHAEALGQNKKEAIKEASTALLHKVIEARLG